MKKTEKKRLMMIHILGYAARGIFTDLYSPRTTDQARGYLEALLDETYRLINLNRPKD